MTDKDSMHDRILETNNETLDVGRLELIKLVYTGMVEEALHNEHGERWMMIFFLVTHAILFALVVLALYSLTL